MEQMIEAGTLPEDFWDTYADTMDAKAAELAEQYHLKPTGNLLNFRTTRNLCDALGVERFTQTGQALRAQIGGGGCYDSWTWALPSRKTRATRSYIPPASCAGIDWTALAVIM